MKKALTLSASLHLATAALLGGLRAGIPASPNVIMVDWVESRLSPAEVSQAPRIDSRAPAPQEKLSPAQPSQPSPSAATASLAPSATSSNFADSSAPEGAEAMSRRLNAEEAYIAGVRRELERNKSYPPIAKRLGQTGRVTLRFKVGSDGQVMESEILGKSPFSSLNDSAAAMLVALKKFQPIPAELNRVSWEFTVPIEYRLE